MIRFKGNTIKLKLNLGRLRSALFDGQELETEVRRAHEDIIEANVKLRMDAHEYLSHRSPNTQPTTGELTNQIKDNITSEVTKPIRGLIIGGTGKKEILDTKDPFINLNRPSSIKNARLWAILEYGSAPHDIYPILKKSLFWYNPDGTSVTTRHVEHPGTEGRHYFLTDTGGIYDSDFLLIDKLRGKFNSIVKRYSYR